MGVLLVLFTEVYELFCVDFINAIIVIIERRSWV